LHSLEISKQENNAMTGVAVINSPHAFHSIRQRFVETYLFLEVGLK
jgi:hypothetical protein